MKRLLANPKTKDKISTHLITTPYNIGSLYDNISHFYDMGVRLIGVGTVESTMQIGQEYIQRYLKEMAKVSTKFSEGGFEGLYIDTLHSDYEIRLNDRRHYIYDSSGKIIAETYGRAEDDIVSSETYKSVDVSTGSKDPLQDTNIIPSLRIAARERHLEIMKKE
jgi:hypothetical protein